MLSTKLQAAATGRRMRRFVAALVACGLAVAPAAAQTWNITGNGTWNTAGNWTPGIPVPGATTALTFGTAANATASYIATNNIGSVPFDLNSVTFNGNAGTLRQIAGTDPTLNGLNFVGTNPVLTMGAGDVTITSNTTLANTGTPANSTGPVAGLASMTVAGGGGTLTFAGTVTPSPAAVAPVTLFKTSSGSMVFANGGSMDQLSVQNGSVSATGGTLAFNLPNDAGNSQAGLQIGSATGQTASFTASNGATVNAVENIFIGDAAGSTGTMTVTGAGTTVNLLNGASNRLAVGNFGNGTLNITNGGVVNVGRVFSPRLAGSSSTILIDGTGSTLHVVAQLSLLSQGPGTVTVQNGGSIVVDAGAAAFNLGANPTGTGTMTVTGTGTTVNSVVGLVVGAAANSGPFTVNVQNGANFTAGNSVFLALTPGTTVATLNVTGANTTFANAGLFVMSVNGTTLATGATSVLNIGGGGSVTATGINLAPGATVNLNAGGSLTTGSISDPVAGSSGVVNLAASTVLNINQRTATTASLIAGAGSVTVSGTAAQAFAGANTYTGGTTVNSGGFLLAANATGSATGTGPVTVNSGGVLGSTGATTGVGTITGPVTVNSGGFITGGVDISGTLPNLTGILTVNNAVTMAPGATVGIGINGTTVGTEYDQINLGTTGTISFNGARLDATANSNALTPATQILIIQGPANSIAAGNTFFNLPNGAQFNIPNAAGTAGTSDFYRTTINYNYAAGTVVLTGFTPVPEPVHVLLVCGAAGSGLGWWRRRRQTTLTA